MICEQRLRAELAQRGESLGRLKPESHTERTTRLTTERVLDAFWELPVTRRLGLRARGCLAHRRQQARHRAQVATQ